MDAEKHIFPGTSRFNWMSLGVREYTKDCLQVIKTLDSLIYQVHKVANEVQSRIDTIGHYNLFYVETPTSDQERLLCKVGSY